ncbi:hypothetical protein MD537_00525 [Flavihumibacter sediminis]|nr:hypothetical protein [Flavihumibacter sediminis]
MVTLRTLLLSAIKNALFIWGTTLVALTYFGNNHTLDQKMYLYLFGASLISLHFVLRSIKRSAYTPS